MRKTTLILICLLVAATCCPRHAQAQLYLGLRGGATLPQSLYADSRMSDNEWMFTQGHQLKGGVGKGWLAGLDIALALPFAKGLEIVASTDFMQSGMNSDVQEYYSKYYIHRYSQCSSYLMELPRLRNIPLLAGLQYSYPLTTLVSLYGLAQIGANLRLITPWTLAYADAGWTYPPDNEALQYNNMKVCTYTPATTLALRFGGGFIIKNVVTLGFSVNLVGASPLVWDQQETVRYYTGGTLNELVNNTRIEYYNLRPVYVGVSLGYRSKVSNAQRHVQDW